MVPSKRFPVNKSRSVSKFRRDAKRTNVMNVRGVPRGGIRL